MSDIDSTPTSKACTCCKIETLLSSFPLNKATKSGHGSICKPCCALASREYAKKNKEHVTKRKAAHRASPAGQAATAAYNKKYSDEHADELRAKRYANYHATKDERRSRKGEIGRAYWARHAAALSARRKAAYLVSPEARARNIERASDWYVANKNAVLARQKQEYQAHADAIRKRIYLYQKANPEKVRLLHRIKAGRRRARLLDAGGRYTREHIERLLALQRNCCANCATSLAPGYHIDHRLPVAKGGSNHPENIELLCPPCNIKKSAKWPHEFAQENGRLL